MGGSAILTEDGEAESASNPPPTISDGVSTKDGLSEFSGLTENKDDVVPQGGNAMGGMGGPPPPPFRRSLPTQQQPEYDNISQYSNSAPLRSIHTNKGSNGDADTIVSDPTLDAGLESVAPSPKDIKSNRSRSRSGSRGAKKKRSGNKKDQYLKESSSTNSYDKKYSDETEVQATSSDDNPSSHSGGGGNKVVDNIVAAALAYAEKAHGESDTSHGLMKMKGSGTTSGGGGSRTKPPAPMRSSSSSNNQNRPKMKGRDASMFRASTATNDESSSIHSFYTESDAGGGGNAGGGGKSHSTGNPRYTGPGGAAPVDDLVAKALSHAQGQIQSNKMASASAAHQPAQQHVRQVPTMKMERTKSEYSSAYWSRDAGKSVGSMYSQDDEGTEFSGQDGGMHFDC
jgi:hypothetical protein